MGELCLISVSSDKGQHLPAFGNPEDEYNIDLVQIILIVFVFEHIYLERCRIYSGTGTRFFPT